MHQVNIYKTWGRSKLYLENCGQEVTYQNVTPVYIYLYKSKLLITSPLEVPRETRNVWFEFCSFSKHPFLPLQPEKFQKIAQICPRAHSCTHQLNNAHRICTKLCQYIVLTKDNYHTNFQPQRSFRYQIAKICTRAHSCTNYVHESASDLHETLSAYCPHREQ